VDKSDSRSLRSTLYRRIDESFETLVSGWNGEIRAIASVGDTVYVGGSEGKISGYSKREVIVEADARGDRRRWYDGYPIYREGPRIDALLWHDGWLYVAGEFDSVAGIAAGSIARYNGDWWEAL